ncbi:MAG: DNA methylase N-4 [Alphaproteobacteria bacterium]|nr:MAG: DNA methylase N-4 [Alphaproteobacteria bacterium]
MSKCEVSKEPNQNPDYVCCKDQIRYYPPDALTPYDNNARTHDDDQIEVLMGSIEAFGFVNPALIDQHRVIVAGHGRVEAARRLGMVQVPTLLIDGLSEDELKAYRLADNRIAELAGWDDEILAIEFQHLEEVMLDFELDVTGWKPVEIDAAIIDAREDEEAEAAEVIPEVEQDALSKPGDLWVMGKHRLLCGSALESASYERLMAGEHAQLVCQDPPWNIPVSSISGSGKTKHRPFLMANGEMTEDEFRDFIATQLARNIEHAKPGAVIQSFIDWRQLEKVITAGATLGLNLLNVLVWSKGHGTFGSPWRSAHELIVCFAIPGADIKDRVEMGKYGRIRSNVLEVPGMGSFGKGRAEAVASHPTSKPVQLLSELIRDVTDRGDIVLDSFMGSGSALLACERSGRAARGIELDPLYVDVIVRRWEEFTGEEAVLEGDGRTFSEITKVRERLNEDPAINKSPSAEASSTSEPAAHGPGRIRRRARVQQPSGPVQAAEVHREQ